MTQYELETTWYQVIYDRDKTGHMIERTQLVSKVYKGEYAEMVRLRDSLVQPEMNWLPADAYDGDDPCLQPSVEPLRPVATIHPHAAHDPAKANAPATEYRSEPRTHRPDVLFDAIRGVAGIPKKRPPVEDTDPGPLALPPGDPT